jgi:dienelactone hydrolase
MKKLCGVTACLILALFPARSLAQGGGAVGGDGRLVEQTAFVLPSFEQIPDVLKPRYPRELVERMRGAADLELLKIKYTSGGLKVSGFVFKPKETAGKRLPAVVYNRGGVGRGSEIGPNTFLYLYEMHHLASEGFVVLASQYRGYDGGEGKDEVGGADLDDVLSLVALARSLAYVDAERVFMMGHSRGAMMTLQAIHRGAPVRAAVVVGAPTDLVLSRQENPVVRDLARTHWAGGESRLEENIEARSAVRWAERLTAPLLIFQGGADPAVSPRHATALAQKLDVAGNLYELVVYAKDDHFVTRNKEERLRKSVQWFREPPAPSIAQPLRRILLEGRKVEDAVRRYRELKKSQPDRYDFSERELNAFGYELLGQGRTPEAIEIFKLNVEMFPEGFNTYDSLGEAYALAGQKELAIKNYRKSLELNPQNTGAAEALKSLEGK